MASLISVMSPPFCLWSLSVRMVVWWGVLGVLAFCVSFVSCIVMMSGWVLCTRSFSSSILFLMPFMLIWSMTMFLSFGWLLFVSGWVVVCLWRGIVLSVLGVAVTFCVGVWMVHLQSGLYCRCCICAHFRWTQCVWLHLIEVCFLLNCLWQRSQIQMTGVCVVGPGFDSTSPAFLRSSASQAAGSDGRLSQKPESVPHLWEQGLCRHNLYRCLQL